jgi:hypothetical protein
MEIEKGTPQFLATFSIASLGASSWCVTRPQEGHKYPSIMVTSPMTGVSLMAEEVNGSGHPQSRYV